MTTRRVVLLRHAKAEQGGRDRDRALTARGRADAAAAGEWLAGHDATPDVVLASPSRRTVQTWESAAERIPGTPEVRLDERIYDNDVDSLLAVLREVETTAQTVLLVGHNPSTHALALLLAEAVTDPVAARTLDGGFPTATVAVFDVDGDWAEVGEGSGRVMAVTTCRAAHDDRR